MTAGRAVVIGSGLAGTTTALLLAEGGWQVTILERHAIPGGLMQRYRRGGSWFDTGFHLVTAGAPRSVLRGILRRLGTLEDHQFLDPDPAAQFVIRLHGQERLCVPVGIGPALAAAAARWPAQAEAIGRFTAVLRGRLAANAWLAPLAEGAPVVEVPEDSSVSAVLQQCGVQGVAAETLGAACAILAMRADSCPFELFAAFAGSSFAGGWRLRGGGDGLMQPLLARAQALGARLQVGCGAAAIAHDGVNVQAVIDAAGTSHAADLVISAIHPDEIVRLTGDSGFRPGFRARLAEVPDGDGAFLFAAELAHALPEFGRSHQLLRLADGSDCYLVAPDAWEGGGTPRLEAMLWMPVDEVAAWRPGRLGRREPAYQAWKQARAAALLRELEVIYPGLEAAVVRSWAASPLTFRDYLGGRHGGAMGLSHDLGHLGSGRLSPRNKLRNLILTGQSLHHPGILGSLIGGCITAGAVLGRDLRSEVHASMTPA